MTQSYFWSVTVSWGFWSC